MLSIGKDGSETKDGILTKMKILCDKINESRPIVSIEHGAELLRVGFLQRPKSLLVLDSVWRPEVIRAFDIGCPTLVTTRDLTVMDVVPGRVKRISLPIGFNEAESLELFTRSLGYESEKEIPGVARKIHSSCKGMCVSMDTIFKTNLEQNG